MIHPTEIRRKVENQYPAFLRAWLDSVAFFPKRIPANLELPADARVAIEAVKALRDGAKEVKGFGYRVEWEERRLRLLGLNKVPTRIFLDTQEDLLRLIGKEFHFKTFADVVIRLREAFPELENWLRSHQSLLVDLAPDLGGLLEVALYVQEHPRPDCFLRELPLSVDTKFIERKESLLREWFDIILPPHSIRADESHFERRFGFRYAEPHVLVRLLDTVLQKELGIVFAEFSVPITGLSMLPADNVRAFIVENKVNLLTLPHLQRTIALGGLGESVTRFRSVSWLQRVPIYYWGDIDTEGFRILSSLRAHFPEVRSFLMEENLLDRFHLLTVPGSGCVIEPPRHLTENENRAFRRCQSESLRLEQERIPQAELLQTIAAILEVHQ